jgi:hypothetical protein
MFVEVIYWTSSFAPRFESALHHHHYMKNLFDPARASELQARLQELRADSPRLWGRMSPSQALAHCSVALEMALGDRALPRMFIGRLLGPIVKKKVVTNDEPLRPNTPTDPHMVIRDDPAFEGARAHISTLIDRFSTGPGACTSNPHSFFGKMTPDEWAILMYKHVDHHLRQFGA